jgi:hypothetical protein
LQFTESVEEVKKRLGVLKEDEEAVMAWMEDTIRTEREREKLLTAEFNALQRSFRELFMEFMKED